MTRKVLSSIMDEKEEKFNLSIHSRSWIYCSSSMLHTSSLDKANTKGYQGRIWSTNINHLQQHKCNQYFKEFFFALKDKAYSHQVPLLKRTHSRTKCQSRIHCHQIIGFKYFYQTPSYALHNVCKHVAYGGACKHYEILSC